MLRPDARMTCLKHNLKHSCILSCRHFRDFCIAQKPRIFHSENLLITFFFDSFFAPSILTKIKSTQGLKGSERHGEQQEADLKGCRYQGKSDSQRQTLQQQVQVCRRQRTVADKTGQEEISPTPMGSDVLPNMPAHLLRGNTVIKVHHLINDGSHLIADK